MEQIIKQFFSSRPKDQLDNVKQNCLASSNCLYSTSGSFYQLSASTKSFLGIKKKPVAITTDKNVFLKKNLQE